MPPNPIVCGEKGGGSSPSDPSITCPRSTTGSPCGENVITGIAARNPAVCVRLTSSPAVVFGLLTYCVSGVEMTTRRS